MGTRKTHLGRKILSLLGIVAVMCGGSGCGVVSNLKWKLTAKKRQAALLAAARERAAEAEAQLGKDALGEVSHVDAESGFVLVRQLVGQQILPNAPLIARGGGGGVAKLRASTAAKGSFIAADILSGMPTRGDAVFIDKDAVGASQAAGSAVSKPTDAGGSRVSPAQPNETSTAPTLDPLLPPMDELKPPDDESTLAEPKLPE